MRRSLLAPLVTVVAGCGGAGDEARKRSAERVGEYRVLVSGDGWKTDFSRHPVLWFALAAFLPYATIAG